MFFWCELKKLRKLKAALLARYRCEKHLAAIPGQLDFRIANCDEAAALKVAEENLENAKRIDAANRKKRVRRATFVTAVVALLATVATSLLLSLSALIAAIVIAGGTLVLTLIVHLIAKSVVKNGRARNEADILACEEELALATATFEAAKAIIEQELQDEIAFYESLLKDINTAIQKNPVVHDCDKNYNTVCQIIWCIEHKYARSVKEAKQWIARANHSKYVRARLDEINLNEQDDQDVEIDATEGQDYSEEIPETTEAEA